MHNERFIVISIVQSYIVLMKYGNYTLEYSVCPDSICMSNVESGSVPIVYHNILTKTC